jgi:hypothetical protein
LRGRSFPPHSEHGFFVRSIIFLPAPGRRFPPRPHTFLVKTFFEHVLNRMQPQAIATGLYQHPNAMQEIRRVRHEGNLAQSGCFSKKKQPE